MVRTNKHVLIITGIILFSLIFNLHCKAVKPVAEETTITETTETETPETKATEGNEPDTDGEYSYETVEGDPLNTKIYTLDNGLKVYISPFKDEPRIQTLICVRAGSKYDPAETTGLAHYLEHMLFKGTNRMGTINWEEEKKLLQQISDLYEQHKNETDIEKKNEIYKKIDETSLEASKYAVPNEYDKMISSLGAKGTNAFTSNDRTVYINDIPSNEFEKWLKIESERFQMLVLRLFHTEMEAVYEEFNISQDRDSRWSLQKVLANLVPNHPYGTQTTIGEGEHLKNPSMVNIHNYFDQYYKPNNIAICLSGDIDPEAAIKQIDKYFGEWKSGDVPVFKGKESPDLTKPIVVETLGPETEHVYIGYKFDGVNTEESELAQLVDMLLANSQAGLYDIKLKQGQKVLEATSFPWVMKDYTFHFLYGIPREGQTLEEVKDLLLAEIETLKKGDFPDWLLPAVIKDFKLNEMRQFESNWGRGAQMMDAFINETPWEDQVNSLDNLAKYTKEDVVAFVNKHYGENYVISYKRKGEPDRYKVDKPEITPIELNRDNQSDFYKEFDEMEAGRVTPIFLDYDKDIQKSNLSSGVELNYIENKLNETFSMNYIFDMGREHDRELSLAISYLPYLGTEKFTAEQLKEEFYKLGVTFDVFTGERKSYVTLSGLEESLEKGVKLFEHVLENVQVDEAKYDGLVQDILKRRADAKDNKSTIFWRAMLNYAKYGPSSSFTDILSEEELNNIDPSKLVDKLKGLKNYKHRVFYYGQNKPGEVAAILNQYHKVPAELMDYPEKKEYPELALENPTVYFTDYEMKRAQVLMFAKEAKYDKEFAPYANIFNEYFGRGLSSIVFQEIREQKGLAYSAFSSFSTPRNSDQSHYVNAYVSTDAHKMKKAIDALKNLMDNMPEAEKQFEAAKDAALKKIETDRITRSQIYWNYENAKNRGLDYDQREEIYNKIKDMTLEDLKDFFVSHIAGKNYTMIVMGSKEELDLEVLKTMGEFKELSLEEIFNY